MELPVNDGRRQVQGTYLFSSSAKAGRNVSSSGAAANVTAATMPDAIAGQVLMLLSR